MTYPKQLLRLQPKRGFIYDTADQEASLDFYTECSNVIFRDGFATRLQGQRAAYAPEIGTIAPTALYHAVNSILLDADWWLMLEADGTANAMQAGVVSQIDNGLLSPVNRPQRYTSALINNIPIISNGINEPVYWPGTGLMQTLPDWTPTESAKSISVLKFHVFACNISGPAGDLSNMVRWSSATEPGTVPQFWQAAESNDAGDVLLADSPGPILCAVPMGDTLFIYKRNATYQARYVGGQNVYSFRKVSSASGALTPRSVCDVGGAHLVVSDGDILLTDGTTRRSIGESRVKDFLFDQLNSDESGQVFCTYNEVTDEVLIGFPSAQSLYCDVGLVYDLSKDAFGVVALDQVTHAPTGLVRDLTPADVWQNRTETWEEATAVWAASSSETATDSLMLVGLTTFTQTDVNQPYTLDAIIGRTGLTFGDPERLKFVKSVRVRSRNPHGQLFVKVGGQMVANGPTTWSDEVSLANTEEIANCFAVGRYISVSIRSESSIDWKITGIDLEADLRGYF